MSGIYRVNTWNGEAHVETRTYREDTITEVVIHLPDGERAVVLDIRAGQVNLFLNGHRASTIELEDFPTEG